MDLELLELENLGFPMLAEWIHEGEISNVNQALKHLEENRHMKDDENDVKAFKRAEKIIRDIFQ